MKKQIDYTPRFSAPIATHVTMVVFLAIFVVFPGTGCSKREKVVKQRIPISLRSVPPQVNINLISHGKKLGTTPWKNKIMPGTYIFEFSKPGYKTTWRKIVCKENDRQDIQVNLKPTTASAILETSPPGTSVLQNGKQIGVTPLPLHNLSVGIHKYTLRKPGCSAREVQIKVVDERPQLIKVNMTSNLGTLLVTSSPATADILIDKSPRGKTLPKQVRKLTVEQGVHTVTIQKPGYTPYNEKVTLTRGKVLRINARLQVLPGSLTVETSPPGAALFVNKKRYNNTPATIKNLTPGKYHIKVSLDKYDDSTRDIMIAPGQSPTVRITMGSNMGGVDLIINPTGVTIYVDGKKIGVTRRGETDVLSKVLEVRNLKSGIHRIRAAHKRAVPPSKTFKIKISKGKISRPKQITFWVKDSYLKLDDGSTYTGRIAKETDDEVLFEHSPSVRIRYGKASIKILRKLKPNE
ncbi:MAG: PEGA domain-containing protein [Kiritimatiellaeota bacterium]|nr:PEGA domain-containing protein [Kiritimatiellota bacterium]